MKNISVFDIGLEGLKDLLVENNFPKYRGKQVFNWLSKGVISFSDMKNLPKNLVEFLGSNLCISTLKLIEKKVDSKDGTQKYLFQNLDGLYIETVLMKYNYGNTVCISTQCGCRMGCDFCATGKDGLMSNLSVSDMVSQILLLDDKVNHVVIMGMGEPFDNYENLRDFINIIHSSDFMNIGLRSITVSSCGIIDRIDDFKRDFPQVNLAISLHSANESTRSSIMPINKKYPINLLMPKLRAYTKETGRRITFEYALLKDVNDSDDALKELIELVRGMNCHINLIPFNSIGEGIYMKSDRIEHWYNKLNSNNVSATIRRSLGANIDGACGQLRRKRI